MGQIIPDALLFAALLGLYFFLAGTFDGIEIAAALVAAGIGTSFTIALRAVAKRRFRMVLPLTALLRPFMALLPEALVVGRELLTVAVIGSSRHSGDFVHQPFKPGGADPASAGRRALTIIGLSLAPRTYVVRGERGNVLLLHGLPAKPASADADWPA